MTQKVCSRPKLISLLLLFIELDKKLLDIYTVKPRYKAPQYNGNLDIKEVFGSTEDWWTNFTA